MSSRVRKKVQKIKASDFASVSAGYSKAAKEKGVSLKELLADLKKIRSKSSY